MKVAINRCHGGFGLSHEAVLRYCEIKGLTVYPEKTHDHWLFWTYWTVKPEDRIESKEGAAFHAMPIEQRREYNEAYSKQVFYQGEIARNDPALIQAIEELGGAADGEYAEIDIVEIPDDANWQIEEYDGMEHVAEVHRIWS